MAEAIVLQTLGPVRLTDADGHEAHGLLAQPRRLALLAYLAVAIPRGFQRRDVILTFFWPELDQPHARAALRQALRVIRGSLGDVVVTRGDEDVGLDFARIGCDADAFDRAIAECRWEDALELYRGDFLDGFFISGAPEFERWVEKERARLRGAAVRGAHALVERAVEAGDIEAGARWAERGLWLAPLDEALVRQQISILDRLGDRAGAVQTYEGFAARLERELDVRPSAETQALLTAVRERDAVAGPIELPSRVFRSGGLEKRSARVVWPGAAAALALVLTGAVVWSRGHAGPRLKADRVVVASFTNRTTDTTLDQLGDLAAEWTARALAQTGLLEVADPAGADPEGRTQRRQVRADTMDGAAAAHSLARATMSGTAVWGSFYRRGDSLVFDAQIGDEREGRLISALGPVMAPLRDPRPAVATLSQRVVGTLAAASDPRLNDWMRFASQPPSYEAYRLFAAGVAAATRLATLRDALRAFYQASALDSTFTLPLVWAAFVHHSLNECDKTDSLARVLRMRHELLARFDQWYLDREVSQCRGDMAAAYQISRQIAQALPSSELSAEFAGRAALSVNRPREAIAILTRLHPAGDQLAGRAGFYYLWLTASYHILGEHREELAAAQRFRRDDPDRRLGMLRDELFALAALGRVRDVEHGIDEIGSFPPHLNWKPAGIIRETAIELRVHGDSEASREVFQRALAWIDSRPPEAQAAESLRFERLMTLYAANSWDAAGTLAAELVREQPDSVSYTGLWGAIAAQRGDARTAARADSLLASVSRPVSRGFPTYWRACIAARRGDKARAVALLQQAQAEGLQALTFPTRYGVYGYLYYDYLHRDPSFEMLHDYAPFHELLRPKG